MHFLSPDQNAEIQMRGPAATDGSGNWANRLAKGGGQMRRCVESYVNCWHVNLNHDLHLSGRHSHAAIIYDSSGENRNYHFLL